MKRNGLVEEYYPLFSKARIIRAVKEGHHEHAGRSDLAQQVRQVTNVFVDVPKVREYYGDEIAIYFEWMNHFQRWLLIPAFFAILVFTSNTYIFDPSESPMSGLFSILMSIWGTLFLVHWRRHCRGLNITWDDYVKEDDGESLRKEFRGTPYINPVTDEPDTTFSSKQRLPLYLKSFAICFPCWVAICFIIICFLNVTGVIRPDHHGGAFDMPFLSHLADPGALCDPEGNMNMVFGIAQAIVTMILNFKFRDVAIYTSKLENHKTENDFQNSVFIKRFIFEFTDFQLYLFYIGIYQLNLPLLRVNLVSLFMVDEARRIICESLIPYLT